MERKCIVPKVIERSGGKAICSDVFKSRYLDKSNCNKCPKYNGILPATVSLSKADSDAWDIRRRLGYS